jgi:hypothetical protein
MEMSLELLLSSLKFPLTMAKSFSKLTTMISQSRQWQHADRRDRATM